MFLSKFTNSRKEPLHLCDNEATLLRVFDPERSVPLSMLVLSAMDMSKAKGVPVDIATEILTRLPVKSVFRFRAACKSWCSSIDHPLFVEMHLKRNSHSTPPSDTPPASSSIMLIPDPYVLLSNFFCATGYRNACRYIDFHLTQVEAEQGGHTVVKLSSSSKICIEFPNHPSFRFVGSCNGLLCFSSRYLTKYWGPISFISNPATEQYFRLPDTTQKIFGAVGFGVCSSTQQLKLVKVYKGWPNGKVYTIGGESNSWRQPRAMLFYVSYFAERGNGVFANGSVHWLVHADDFLQILSFDMEREEFYTVLNPNFSASSSSYNPKHHRPEEYFQLLVFGGGLSISDCFSQKNAYDIWVMKEKNAPQSWIKQFVIRTDPIRQFIQKTKLLRVSSFCTRLSVRPISFLRNGELLLLCGSRFLVSYNLESKRATLVKEYANFKFCQAFPFELNFFSLEFPCES